MRTRRKVSIKKRFENGRAGRPVIYTVFTVPPGRREAAADPKTWTKWRKAIKDVLKRRFGLDFAVERTDPAGDSKPDVWHPHFNFLWVQRATGSFRPFIQGEKLEYLKRAWAKIIGHVGVVNIHTKYCKGRADSDDDARQLNHWYSYMGRTWADWAKVVKRHVNVRWMGSYPKKPEKPPLPIYCEDCKIDIVRWKTSLKWEADCLAKLEPLACWVSISNRIIGEGRR